MKKVESGHIFEIPLPFDFGFAYGKYLDVSMIMGHKFDGHHFKVFNLISQEPIKSIDDLKNCDLLFGQIILVGKPNIRGKNKRWKAVGKELNELDLVVPDFKSALVFPYIVEDESKIDGDRWDICRRDKSIKATYNQLSHLEQPTLYAQENVEIRIVMEILRQRGDNPLKYYPDAEDYIVRTYWKMINVPIYSTIPKEIRGRAIEVVA